MTSSGRKRQGVIREGWRKDGIGLDPSEGDCCFFDVFVDEERRKKKMKKKNL